MDTPNIDKCVDNYRILECHNNGNGNGNSYIGNGGFNRKMEYDEMLCTLLLFDYPYYPQKARPHRIHNVFRRGTFSISTDLAFATPSL